MASGELTEDRPQLIAVAVVRQGEHYVVGRRMSHQTLAGYCEFPGGKRRPGESASAAATRECWEETGLQVTAVEELAVVEHRYAHGAVRISFVLCTPLDDAAVPTPPFAWHRQSELRVDMFPAANAEMLKRLGFASN